MKIFVPLLMTTVVVWNLWLGLQLVLLILGTASDWFRYNGEINWTGDLAFFGKIVLESILVTFIGATLIGLASGARKE